MSTMSAAMAGGDKAQNIQVFVRCRPLNEAEKSQRSYSVVDTPNSREITVKEKATSSLTKTFQFDKVFGIKSKQIDVYRSVVEPLICQVMHGYNCTVFAYGQTGTGKTFTMEGGDGRGDPNMTWENDPTAGIIPRALAQLFDELRVQQEAEFSVRVSFLELYNEDIFDLLSAEHDLNKLRLYEDSTKKGSVIIQGLEEVQVHSKREVYEILEKGSKKRQTAATLMNAHSSRSHTVFTVTVHMKENSVEGEEVLRIGKLNLVDLAGSENVGRSGAVDKRAREAGNINQSLLTLGRVITCLVERAPHIPYRESKLTRLLQDSLGGRTKTSIIATVSPAGINLEETLSTLDYAHRAKNITNKPEVNQKMSKRAVLKEYTEEIERLRKDLMASREKNGVFLANENYQSMLAQIEIQSQELAEKIGQIKAIHEEMTKKEKMYEEVAAELADKEAELESTATKLTETEHSLACTRTVLQKTAVEKEEQKHLVEKHRETEIKLKEQAKKLLEVADVSTKEGKLLHDKLDRMKRIEECNKEAKEDFSQVFSANVDEILTNMESYGAEHLVSCADLRSRMEEQLEARSQSLLKLSNNIASMIEDQKTAVRTFDSLRLDVTENERSFMVSEQVDMDEVAQNGVKVVEEFQKSILKPLLNQIAENMKIQAEKLNTMKKSFSLDLERLVKSVNVYSTATVENMDGLKKYVEEYSRTNKIRANALLAKTEEIKTSEDQFKMLLDTLMKSYKSHSDLVRSNTETIKDTAGNDLTCVESLVAKSEELGSQVGENTVKVLTDVEEEKNKISSYVQEAITECTSINESIIIDKEKLQSSAISNVENSKANWEKYKQERKVKVEDHTRQIKEKQELFKKEIENNSCKLKLFADSLKQEIETAKDTDEASVLNLATKIESLGDKCESTMEEQNTRIKMEKDTVTSFLSEVLRVDEPTGSTPARTTRSFPRYLEATSPHQRILHRFRAQAETAVVAARLPLDDSDNDDSLISTSDPSLSREGSDGDIKMKRRSPHDGSSKQNCEPARSLKRSDSQSSSRNSSRQNSCTDLRPRAASITSDVGSEIQDKDQENVDPNFRKPSTKQSQVPKRTGSLRRPEVKTPRSGLGSQNS